MTKTKLVVLTGGPCCGKTTLIAELVKRGLNIVKESAREVLNEGRFSSKQREQLQTEILLRQLKKESGLGEGVHFLDRSAVDCIAYSLHFLGYIPSSFEGFSLKKRYWKVFLLDQLEFVKDAIRVESDEQEAQELHSAIEQAYLDLGYSLTRVPILPGNIEDSVQQRANYILQNLGVQDGVH
jgi:predicted ATPase